MKVKILARRPEDYIRETKRDIFKVPRNYDPSLHPFEAPREYKRALNAVKMDKLFAKPFLGSLDGHRDGISCMCKHPTALSVLLSGAYDGELRIWDLAQRKCTNVIKAHESCVRGIDFNNSDPTFVSVGDDKNIHLWAHDVMSSEAILPLKTYISKTTVTSVSHHFKECKFGTSGEICQIWDESRSVPLKTFKWGVDSFHCIRFNPAETNILGACAGDCSIMICDIRNSVPIRKVVLDMKSNSICWNPMEPFIFSAANEDYNVYTFDMRNLSTSVNIHKDHVEAVIDLDYSPTGKELVAGSYDKTIRIFSTDKSHSRDIYHTKRMQRLSAVLWSLDNKYILSASDEMNIRMWKAESSKKLGVVSKREKAAFEYQDKLKDRFATHPEVKRILRHHHVPKHVYNARKELSIIKQSQKRKEGNRRAHSKPGTVPFAAERKKHVRKELK